MAQHDDDIKDLWAETKGLRADMAALTVTIARLDERLKNVRIPEPAQRPCRELADHLRSEAEESRERRSAFWKAVAGVVVAAVCSTCAAVWAFLKALP